MIDQELFEQALRKVLAQPKGTGGIGTLGEKSLHAVLKAYYEPYTDNHEILLGNYVADIVGENGVIEIQSRQFEKLRGKLHAFLPLCPVTVVYPISAIKWLTSVDPVTGERISRRRSPKQGSLWLLFQELYQIKPFLPHPGLTIRAVLLETEETRLPARKPSRGKTRKLDLVPLRLIEEYDLREPPDYAKLLPALPEPFTSRELAAAEKISLSLAQTSLNVMYTLGCVERCGKDGNRYLYRRGAPIRQKEPTT